MYGRISFRRIDTAPGAGSAFAPPSGWSGDYRAWMRRRWRENPGVRQHVVIAGRLLAMGLEIDFSGPYAGEAKEIALATAGRFFQREESGP